MLYNENTTTPRAMIGTTIDVTDDTFAKFHIKRAKASLEEAMAQNIDGFIYWMENGRIFRAHLTPTWAWKPLTEDGYEVPGINWGTKYFFTSEAAEEFRAERLKAGLYQTDSARYHEDGDVWSVHFHYEHSNW